MKLWELYEKIGKELHLVSDVAGVEVKILDRKQSQESHQIITKEVNTVGYDVNGGILYIEFDE